MTHDRPPFAPCSVTPFEPQCCWDRPGLLHDTAREGPTARGTAAHTPAVVEQARLIRTPWTGDRLPSRPSNPSPESVTVSGTPSVRTTATTSGRAPTAVDGSG